MTEKEIRRIQFEVNHKYGAGYIEWFDTEWRKAVNRLKATGLDFSKISIIGKPQNMKSAVFSKYVHRS